MPENKKIHIGSMFMQSPDFSNKTNKFHLIIMVLLAAFLITTFFIKRDSNTETMNRIINYVQLFSGVVLCWFYIIIPVLNKIFGGQYIHFLADKLEIKDNYFQKAKRISWQDIEQVKFEYATFDIYQKLNRDNGITVYVPYYKNMEIRKHFKIFAELNGYKIVEP